MPLTEQTLARAEELIARYPQRRSALLPLLFLVQAEDGYVSPAGVAQVAELLGLTKAEVGAVATFYTMFRRRPVGRYLVSVCRTLSCQMVGSDQVTAALLDRVGVPLGGTDESGMVTVEEVECLAACDGAPVLQVNTENYERITPEQAVHLVEALLQDELPPPSFAAEGSVTEPTTAGLHWRLAGLGDPPPRFAGRGPAPSPDEVPTAFPPQPPAPEGPEEDPTTRSVQQLRTGVDHGGSISPRPPGQAPAGTTASGGVSQEGPEEPEAQAAQPKPRPPGKAPAGAQREAGPHEREQPGGSTSEQ